ncbi:hypothetical protein [Sphingomonas sp. Y38-1Y]|uniref:hypothetical protein n=1 Tax=Sphingomonas sp. Y38-1Y TaxID=3078265 RepID=UPI0028F00D13|nr:hypothetical protein [Sphingomonas sp. Y38-1Y]
MGTTFGNTARRSRGDDRFFAISSLVMAATVVGGFSTQLAMGRSSFGAPPLIHVHAVVFMGWVAIYVVQTWLAATGERALHRRLGWVAAVWAAAMVVMGIAVTIGMARRGMTPFFFQPAYFVVMNTLSVLFFAGLTIAAIVRRRQPGWHKRLHYCGMAVLLAPAFGRLLPMPLLIPHAGEAVFAALMLFPLAGVIADRRRSGRVHPAWGAGIVTLIAMQVAINALAFGGPGAAFHRAIASGTPGAALDPLAFPPPPGAPLITGRAAAM